MDVARYPAFFRSQVERLLRCGYHKALGISDEGFCENYLDRVLKSDFAISLERHKYYNSEMNMPPPAMIVIPNCILPVSEQIALVEFEGHKGRSLIYSEHLENSPKYKTKRDDFIEPDFAYLVTGVVDGGYIGYHDDASRLEEIAKRTASLPLTVAEGIALLIHFQRSLYKYPFALIGSIFGLGTSNSGKVPVLKRDQETGAPLLARESYISLWPYATPTCVRRIIIP